MWPEQMTEGRKEKMTAGRCGLGRRRARRACWPRQPECPQEPLESLDLGYDVVCVLFQKFHSCCSWVNIPQGRKEQETGQEAFARI